MNSKTMIGTTWLTIMFALCVGGSYSLKDSDDNEKKNPAKVHTVQIVHMKFEPAEIHVRKGDRIIFQNKDLVTHDVTELIKKAWKSPPIPSGKSWTMLVRKSDRYYCSIHQVMKGSIVVDE